MTELIQKTRTGDGLLVQGFRYLMVGGTATAADWMLFTVVLYFLGLHYLAATAISLVLGTFLNYVLSVKFVFSGRRFARHVELLLVYSVNFAGLVINIIGMVTLVEVFRFSPFGAKGLLMVTLFGWNYLVRRHVIFGDGNGRLPRPVQRALDAVTARLPRASGLPAAKPAPRLESEA